VRHGTANFRGRLILAQPFIDDLAEQVVIGPGQIFDLGD
jgi:hypothetical protein